MTHVSISRPKLVKFGGFSVIENYSDITVVFIKSLQLYWKFCII